MMNKPIRKAVLPVAGLGTRFLPATKAIPKEMLTVVDRPILQHVVDEAREAGIEHFIFVTGRNKGVIEDHFDMAYELEDTLKRRGKTKEYEALMADLPTAGDASFTRQQAPLGLGHAVWCARELVGDEPFAVLLPDMVTMAGARKTPLPRRNASRPTTSTAATSSRSRKSRHEETHQYGVVAVGEDFGHAFRDHRHGREAAEGHGALEPHHLRPLYPAAGNLRHSRDMSRKAPAAKSSSPTA